MKRQATEWEKIFADRMPDRELVLEQIEISQHTVLKKKKNPNSTIRRWAKDMKRYVHMASKHIQRCSASLVFTKMPFKTTMNYHYTLDRMTKMKNQ